MLAMLDNFPTDIGDENEQTKFIHHLQGSIQILSYIRNDRHLNIWEQRYTAGQFFHTIKQVIHTIAQSTGSLPSSRQSSSSRSSSTRNSRIQGGSTRWSDRKPAARTSGTSRLKQLNAMHTESFDLLNLHSLLDTTDINDASEDHALYSLGIGLNQLQSNLDKYRSFPCAVCNNSGHSFQNCPVLQDTPKVREAYGKLRAYLNRCCSVANKLNKSLSDLQATPVQVLQQYSLLSAPPASPSLAAISGLTNPVSYTHLTLPTKA